MNVAEQLLQGTLLKGVRNADEYWLLTSAQCCFEIRYPAEVSFICFRFELKSFAVVEKDTNGKCIECVDVDHLFNFHSLLEFALFLIGIDQELCRKPVVCVK